MRYNYGEFEGSPFPTPESLFPPTKVVQFILQHGEKALDAMNKVEGDQEKQYIQGLIDAGFLERDEKTGELRLTPKMVRGLEHRALLDMFADLKKGSRDGHATITPGPSDERIEGTKPYEFGDPLSEIDVAATMRNAFRRGEEERRRGGVAGAPVLPIHINSGDFELHLTEGRADCATCILLDMSGSMMRYGRFYQAKRVAMGLAAMVRGKFPLDTLDYAGFYSLACTIPERELPLAMPKPVSMYDSSVRLRVPLEQAEANPAMIPQHFTNLHLGLRLARQTLARRGAANKQIFVITDGQPTAHVETSHAGVEMLHLLYPPSERTSSITLQEALRCHQMGIRIATFALIEDYWGMDWVGFVDQMTRLTRGVAYYCASENLGSTVVESYLNGKRRKSFTQ
ncbi:MAG: VWA domain-containing protein [Planctomycetes bacterium]|nr:VWA domain-containing protein [Planctomycetota bacterium]